jgi:hypothetical protein
MPTYNEYTKTNDFPIQSDVWEKVLGTYRVPRLTSVIINPNSPYRGIKELQAVNFEYSKVFNEWVKKYNVPQSVIDEWNRLTLAAASENEQKSFWKRMAEKVSNTVSNFVQNAGNVLSNAGESVLLAPLLPFKRAMVNALKRKGENVTTSTPLGEVASLFKQKIVDRQSSTNYINHFSLDPEQITLLISSILPFFTAILEKIKSGTASADERLIGGDAEEDGKNVTTGGQPTSQGVNAPTSSNNWFSQYKYLIIGVAVVVLFLMFKKKK